MKKMPETGPTYDVELIETLPLSGGMLQQMANREDLRATKRVSQRTAAAYEVLLSHFLKQREENDRLREAIEDVIRGEWSVTTLQEALGDLR